MKKLLFILALIGAGFLVYYIVTQGAGKIEQDIKGRVAQGFEAENISNNIRAEVSGRDVVLTGSVSEEDSKREASQVARALDGVRAVDNHVQVVSPPSFNVSTNASGPKFKLDPEMSEEVPEEVEADKEGEEALSFNPDTLSVEEEVAEAQDDALDFVESDIAADSTLEDAVETEEPEEVVEAPALVADACQSELAALLEKEKIMFGSGTATIQKSSHGVLNRLADEAKNCKDSVIHIHGYTDNIGDVKENTVLSLNRAKSVGKYLISKGVRQEIRVIGNGPNDPIADNKTEEGRAQNRRIEFKVVQVTSE